jgi:hypothetical protein
MPIGLAGANAWGHGMSLSDARRPMIVRRTAAFPPAATFAVAIWIDRFMSIRDVAKCLKCANTGHSRTAWRTGRIDPKHAFKIGLINGRKGRGSGLRLKRVGWAKRSLANFRQIPVVFCVSAGGWRDAMSLPPSAHMRHPSDERTMRLVFLVPLIVALCISAFGIGLYVGVKRTWPVLELKGLVAKLTNQPTGKRAGFENLNSRLSGFSA